MNLSIAIVGVDLRSAWLALELHKLHFNVTYIDLSSSLPRPPSEDLEGPFGHFLFDSWDSSFFELLQFEEPLASLPQGFTVWTSDGPVEYKSMLYEVKRPFLNPLLHRLSHDFNQTSFTQNISLKTDELAKQNRFAFRNYTRNSSARLQERLKETVTYLGQISLKDISFQSRNLVSGLEFDGAIKGHQAFDFVVWSLTEEEALLLPEKLHQQLPRRQQGVPEFVWLPFEFKFDDAAEFQVLPEHFFVVDDIDLAFNQENFFVCKKSLALQQYQVWSLVSFSQRLNESYLQRRAEAIRQKLNQKCPRFNVQLHSLPSDLAKAPEERVPARFIVWSEDSVPAKTKYSNLFLNAPDTWSEYSWFEDWTKQKDILEIIASEYEKRKRKLKVKSSEKNSEKEGNSESAGPQI